MNEFKALRLAYSIFRTSWEREFGTAQQPLANALLGLVLCIGGEKAKRNY